MEASPALVIEYFNGEKQNLIPLFQRPYTWEEKNWKALWEDILVLYESDSENIAPTHFMGAIVSMPATSVPVGVSKFLIIDGQQRLTTIAILLCALRNKVDKQTASRIQEIYLTNRHRGTSDTPKLVPTQSDRDDYIQLTVHSTVTDSNSLIIQAYQFFQKKLNGKDPDEEQIKVENVLQIVEKSLQVVMINLGEKDDPYLIFESLNFKGSPLTQADLIRNFLLMKFQHSMLANSEQERVYKKYWVPLEQTLGNNLTEFLRHYLMKDGQNVQKGNIYTALKYKLQAITNPEGIEDEMIQMLKFGQIYYLFLDPSHENETDIQKRLFNLDKLTVTTSYPFLLRLFEARENGALTNLELEKCLGLIESFFIRRSVCSAPTNAHNKLFLQWAKAFPVSEHLSFLMKTMMNTSPSGRFPEDVEFAHAFKMQTQYGRANTGFILARLELSFGHKECVDLNLSTITIEHILPQTLSDSWEQHLGENATEIQKKWLHTFGNLTLTGYNPELSNLPFSDKKEILRQSNFELNSQVCTKEKWQEQEISERADALFESARQLWPQLNLEK